jgi:hypothetical protein
MRGARLKFAEVIEDAHGPRSVMKAINCVLLLRSAAMSATIYAYPQATFVPTDVASAPPES